MPKNLKNSIKEIDDFFAAPPDAEEKAWGIIHDFYNLLLSYMREVKLTQSGLADKLGKSRSAISQMFNKNPNVSILKLVEIAEVVGIDICITSPQLDRMFGDVIEETIEVNIFDSLEAAAPDFNQDNVKPLADFNDTIDPSFYQALNQVM